MEYKQEKNRLSVGMGLFLCCIILTTLIGLFAGLLISNFTHDNYLMQAPDVQLQQPAESTALPAPTANEGRLTTVPGFKQENLQTRVQVIELCAPSVVGIDITYTANYGGGFFFGGGYTQEVPASGSGVILTEDGYIATCAHVVSQANTLQVTTYDGQVYNAVIVGSDEQNDIAIIKVEATGLIPALLGESDMVTVGEEVIVIGNPLGELRGSVSHGIISASSREIQVEGRDMSLLQTDAAINHGNSGGGLFNANGQLIGIVNAKVDSSGVEGLGFAIPLNSVIKEINDLVSFGYIKDRAYLGVKTTDVTLRKDYYRWGGFSTGIACVQVTELVKDGAAQLAGVKVGDLIMQLDGQEITSGSGLSLALRAYKPGDSATLTVQRDGEELKLPVTFHEYTPEG